MSLSKEEQIAVFENPEALDSDGAETSDESSSGSSSSSSSG